MYIILIAFISIISQFIVLLPYIALFVLGEYFICNKYPRYALALPMVGLIYFVSIFSLYLLFPAGIVIKSKISLITLLQTAEGQTYILLLTRLCMHSLPAIGSFLMMRHCKKQNAHQ